MRSVTARRRGSLWILCVVGCASQGASLSEDDPRIQSLLHGATEAERTQAMEELSRVGAPTVAPLARLLESPEVDDTQGAWIAETLGDLGPTAEPAARALAARLASGGECSATTSWALGRMGPAGVPWLIQALRDGRPKGRMWAAHSLRHFGSTEGEALAALIAALGDDVAEVRAEAAWSLAAMRPAAPSVQAALRGALQDGDESVREAAREALEEISAVGAR